eukprot:TRINITY_DN5607_c0_g1_i1.p1 TRINITY_DN5607_c0_g1~~TRINITY_DN5607_c0_g1_i1.p1  ORF type:complete len:104 (-),score=24.24 TRINITY_DN5607_c0_g1_i1:16-327(-)
MQDQQSMLTTASQALKISVEELVVSGLWSKAMVATETYLAALRGLALPADIPPVDISPPVSKHVCTSPREKRKREDAGNNRMELREFVVAEVLSNVYNVCCIL